MKRCICLFLYYNFAQFLPNSYYTLLGGIANKLRIFLCRNIFCFCGRNVSNINRCSFFGKGNEIEIGDYSSIGANCTLHPKVKIGRYVMMGPEVYFVGNNHITADVGIPMCFQGKTDNQETIIEDDVWIGARVIIMPGIRVGHGSILAAGAIVTKNVEPYSVVGGNPAKLIRKRK